MEAMEREELANELENLALSNEQIIDTPFARGMARGLRMAACLVRDNHPKEDDE